MRGRMNRGRRGMGLLGPYVAPPEDSESESESEFISESESEIVSESESEIVSEGPHNDGQATATLTGTPTEGQTLTATFNNDDPDGTASGITYQWQRNGGNIGGATASTRTLSAADVGSVIRCEVKYTDAQSFSETIYTTASASVTAVDNGDATASLTGTATEGQTLTATFNDNDPDGAATGVAYQWQRGGVDIVGATANTRLLNNADVGSAMRCKVTYTDAQGFPETIYTSASATVSAVDSGDATATLTGTPTEGQTLTATFNNDDPDGAATGTAYQWQRNGTDIGGATSSTRILANADVGTVIRCKVTYTDAQGFAETIYTNGSASITAIDSGDATASLTGTATEGQTLTATFNDNDPDGPASGITYQWQRGGVDVVGATASTRTLTSADVGSAMRCKVSYTDGQGFSEVVYTSSSATVTGTDTGDATASITGSAIAYATLSCVFANNDPDGSASGITYQWQKGTTDISGETGTSYICRVGDIGSTIRCKVAYTDAKGFSENIVTSNTAAVVDARYTFAIGQTANGLYGYAIWSGLTQGTLLKEAATLPGDLDVRSVSIHPNGKLVAVGAQKSAGPTAVLVYDVTNATASVAPTLHTSIAKASRAGTRNTMKFSKSGSYLGFTTPQLGSDTLQFFRSSDWADCTGPAETGAVNAMDWYSDTICVVSIAGVLQTWDLSGTVATKRGSVGLNTAPNGNVRNVCVRGNRLFVITDTSPYIETWTTANGATSWTKEAALTSTGILPNGDFAVSLDGTKALVTRNDGDAYIYTFPARTQQIKSTGAILQANAISPDGTKGYMVQTNANPVQILDFGTTNISTGVNIQTTGSSIFCTDMDFVAGLP